jgi:hypothetical protein
MTSSLVTAPSISILITGYARFVEQTARTKRSDSVLMNMDLENGDAKELASALGEIADGYGNDRMDEGNN